MALIGGGGKGNSRSNTDSTSTTVNTQETTNNVDNRVFNVGEGGQFVEGDGNYIVSTDHNAIGSATQLAEDAVTFAESIARSGLELSARTTDMVTAHDSDVLDSALGYGRSLSQDSIASVASAYDKANISNETLFSKALSFLTDLQSKAQDSLGDTVKALNAISVEQNKSTDQRVAEVSENTVKYMIYGVIGIAIVFSVATFARSK